MTTSDIITKWLNNTKTDVIANYDKLGLRASGRFANTLEEYLIEDAVSAKFGLLTYPEYGAMEYGRKPSSKSDGGVLHDIIAKWVSVKGLKPKYGTIEQMIWAITNKIHKKGITVPNQFNTGKVFTDVITKQRIDEVVLAVGAKLLEQTKSDILEQFKTQ